MGVGSLFRNEFGAVGKIFSLPRRCEGGNWRSEGEIVVVEVAVVAKDLQEWRHAGRRRKGGGRGGETFRHANRRRLSARAIADRGLWRERSLGRVRLRCAQGI